jgi:hypothetical protein
LLQQILHCHARAISAKASENSRFRLEKPTQQAHPDTAHAQGNYHKGGPEEKALLFAFYLEIAFYWSGTSLDMCKSSSTNRAMSFWMP